MEDLTNKFNKKFGEKDEEDLTDAERRDMKDMLKEIEFEEMDIKEIRAEQQVVLDEFNRLIQATKTRLGVR
jgi:DNA-binding transcriptional regulator YiaG